MAFLELTSADRCSCMTGETYGSCCGPLHAGAAAPTAERLMRSRYSAFAIGDADYLAATWHPSTVPAELDLNPDQQWFSLEIVSRTQGGMLDTEGTVEFRAKYRFEGDRYEQYEVSRFVRVDKRWVYLSPA
jgi:SEC-C motif-containing protein